MRDLRVPLLLQSRHCGRRADPARRREGAVHQAGQRSGKGRLALVGGFVDAGESAEHALRREVREEVQLELDQVRYLSSHPNDYPYQDTIYPVVDLVFVARTPNHDRAAALDGVASFEWLNPHTVDLEDLAFPSMRDAVARYRAAIGS